MKINNILIIFLCVFVGFHSKAQISYGGEPLSFKIPVNKKLAVFNLPAFDYSKMIEEDNQQNMVKPYRYGKTHEVNLSPDNSGSWQTLDDGRKIWRLAIQSQNAYSLSIICNNYKLNENAKLFIYTPDKKKVIGSFTAQNNLESGFFSTVPLPGNEIVIELNLEANTEYGIFKVSTVVHDYKNILKNYGTSEPCNVNINCPEGVNWQDEKRSVVKFTAAGYLCTGALINNTAKDGKPYLLTANHCVGNQTEAMGAVFWFNYESPGCIASGEPAKITIASSTLRATGGNLDFSLLELSTSPASNLNVYYAGWSRSASPPAQTVCIHHPSGDIKKITIDNDSPVIGNYGSGFVENSHWNILEWELGTTEGGSSGSPLFDQNHRIVGDLTGGNANCTNNVNDYFSRFDMSWDYYPEANRQLKAWLDPLNQGVQFLDGYNNTPTLGLDAKIKSLVKPYGTICGSNPISPELVISNNGTDEITSMDISYQANGGNIVTEHWTGSILASNFITFNFPEAILPAGTCNFKVYISNPNGGNDIKKTNDTLTINYFGEQNLEVPQIIGDNLVCIENLASEFSTSTAGTYLWNVFGGKVNKGQGTNTIKVDWELWGDKKIGLNISNVCNSVNAVPLKINVVELGVNLSIKTGANGDLIGLNIKDCNGNIKYEKFGLPSNSLFNESFILEEGCYELNILSGGLNIEELLITDFCSQNTLVSTINPGNTFKQLFEIGVIEHAAEFNVYPNPAIDQLVVEALFSELYGKSRIGISNLSGKVVVPVQDFTEKLNIDVQHLPSGIYVVKIYSPMGNFTRKIVKL
jgi:hypothetical protein